MIELSDLHGSNGYVLNGIDSGDYSGSSVSNAGDVNGEGVDDLLIGAPFVKANFFDEGESYVVFGGSGVGSTGILELSDLNGINGFVINGAGKLISLAILLVALGISMVMIKSMVGPVMI